MRERNAKQSLATLANIFVLFCAGWGVDVGAQIMPPPQVPNHPNGPARVANKNFAQFVQFQAQRPSDDDLSEGYSSIFQTLPREHKLRLARVREALQDGQYGDAVLELEALMNGPESEDYFIGPSDGERTQTSLKAEARRILDSMPPAGREAYELQFGAEARRLLTLAVESGDFEKLTEVSRRYFHTRAGQRATLLAGHYCLNQGQPLSGAVFLQRLQKSRQLSAEYEPELSLLLAACWRYADKPQEAIATLESLKRRFPNATVHVADRNIKLFDDPSEALAWLDKALGPHRRLPGLGVSEWLLYRGDPSRNAPSPGSLPLMHSRWRVPTANDWADEQRVQSLLERQLEQGIPALPLLQPLAVGDMVLMRGPRQLLGVDMATGKRIWLYPWEEHPSREADRNFDFLNEPRLPSPGRAGANRRENELMERIWQDAPYGQISSDGESVYLLDEMDYAMFTPGVDARRIAIGAFRALGLPDRRDNNRLVALDLKTQGKLRWIVGRSEDGDPGDEPRLAEAFFLGPPLVLSGQLYVLTEIKGELRLVVLDANTGHLQWSQQLAHFDAPFRTIAYDTTRRLGGASPSYGDGVLICPTGAGAVVAVDIHGRSLLWGYQYETVQAEPVNRRGVFRSARFPSPPLLSGDRWADSTVTIADGRVVLTPAESDELHCLDLITGELEWPPQKRNDALYVACVHDGAVVLVCKDQVRAIDLASGEAAWKSPVALPAGGMPSGRGFLSGDQYYLPTSAPELVKLDVREGRLLETIPCDVMLGNLVCHRGQLISQSAQWLHAFYLVDRLQQIVDRRLQEDPNDPLAHEQLGTLLMERGLHREAIAALRRALELYPQDSLRRDGARALLVKTLLAALRENFTANGSLVDEVDRLIDLPQQRAEYMELMADGLQQSGQFARAFQVYLELAFTYGRSSVSVEADGPGDRLKKIDGSLRLDRDRWLRGRFDELLKQASPADREQMLAEADKKLRAALNSEITTPVRDFIDYFATQSIADEARLPLARRLLESGDLLESELLLLGLIESSDQARAARASALMARLMEEAERFEEAAAWYARLAARWPETECLDGKTGKQILDALPPSGQTAKALHRDDRWPTGRAVVNMENKARQQAGSYQSLLVDVLQYDPLLPPGLQIMLSRQENLVRIHDGLGRVQREISLDSPDFASPFERPDAPRAKLRGHLMILAKGLEVMAVDTLSVEGSDRLPVLWREPLIPELPGNTTLRWRVQTRTQPNVWGAMNTEILADGQPVAMPGFAHENGICFQRVRELRCVQPFSGRTVWVRNGVDPGSELFGDAEMVFAVGPNSQTAQVFKLADGTTLGERTVPPPERRWLTLGRQLLTWDDEQQVGRHSLRLRLYDPWTEDDVWVHSFDAGSKAWLVETDELGIVQPDGKFVLLSLADGTKRIEAELQPEPSLQSICVLRSADQYILVTSTGLERTSTLNIAPAPQSSPTQSVNGRVYAFRRPDGELLWPAPVVVENFGLPLDQPLEVPVLFFMRNVTELSNGRSRRTRGSLLCIDRRDGRILLSTDDVPTPIHWYEVSADVEQHTVDVSLSNGRSVSIRFTDEPKPEEPAGRAEGSPASSNAESSRQGLTRLAKAIATAFERYAEQLPRVRDLVDPEAKNNEKKGQPGAAVPKADDSGAGPKKDDDPFGGP